MHSKHGACLTATGVVVGGIAPTQLLVLSEFSELDESFVQLGWQAFAVVLAIDTVAFMLIQSVGY